MMGRFVIAALLLGGCTSAIEQSSGPDGTTSSTSGSTSFGGEEASSAQTTSDPSAGATTQEPASSTTGTSVPWETEGADEGYATTGSCGFTCPPPPGPGGGFSCNFTDQDCAEGEKCAPWANDGGNLWNALRCVPVDPRPGVHGEACTVEGSFVSGIDTCELGAVCTASNDDSPKTNEGSCTALCNAGACPSDTICTVPTPLGVGVCAEVCDPLAQDACALGQACLPAGFGFGCHSALTKTADMPCANTLAACGRGHVCIDASQCDDKSFGTCCAQLCDLEAPDCSEGQTCTDYGSPLSAYSAVGFCEG